MEGWLLDLLRQRLLLSDRVASYFLVHRQPRKSVQESYTGSEAQVVSRGPAPRSGPPSLVPQLALLRAISTPKPPFEALLDPDLDSKLALQGLDN